MSTPFPGMDPYLERAGLWKQVHTDLIVDIRRYLAQMLYPKYQVTIEQSSYLSLLQSKPIGEPDVLIVSPFKRPPGPQLMGGVAVVDAPAADAFTIQLPVGKDIIERHLEILDSASGEVVTAIEILSPTNKLWERKRYEAKRTKILNSTTNFIEIDLLRVGKPMTTEGDYPQKHYRLLVSRFIDRPSGLIYPFSVRAPIPDIPVPLEQGDAEPLLELNKILHNLYDVAMYQGLIDYSEEPDPPFKGEDGVWVRGVVDRGE